MSELLESSYGVDTIAEMARAAVEIDPVNVSVDEPVLIGRLRDGERFVVESMERLLSAPLTTRGTATIYDPSDFVEYVIRLLSPHYTTLWADETSGRITALLDDHADVDDPSWRQHTVRLELQADADWEEWTSRDGKPMSQAQFAEFLEDVAHTVKEPRAADLIQIATTLHAKRSVDFSSALRTDNGDVQFTYNETTSATAGQKGTLEIPTEFRIRLTPWLGVAPVEMVAKLRYRVQQGQLSIWFKLLRPDRVRGDAFAGVIATIREGLTPKSEENAEPAYSIPILTGPAPQQIKPLH